MQSKNISDKGIKWKENVKTLVTKRLSKTKTFVESVKVNGSNFKDETHFLSFAIIITAKNLGDGTNFHVGVRMIGSIKMSGDRFVDVSIAYGAKMFDKSVG